MTVDSPPTTDVPVLDDDPFGTEVLTDPYDFHRRLRDAGPVVFLARYGIYAMGRFDEVSASLRDWETFVSSRGAGLADFAKEQPWRPPSLLLEAAATPEPLRSAQCPSTARPPPTSPCWTTTRSAPRC